MSAIRKRLARLTLLDSVPRRVPVLMCCPLCEEPLEISSAGELACACSRVDSRAGRSGVPLAARIVFERYGWDDGRAKSVAEVARLHGISRARVRALEGPLVVKMRRDLGVTKRG